MEEWKFAKGYESLLMVSSLGNIVSANGFEIIRVQVNNGYKVVYIPKKYRPTKSAYISIHRLVALTFIGNPSNKLFVDHINRDRLNNAVINLRWATPHENALNRTGRVYQIITK